MTILYDSNNHLTLMLRTKGTVWPGVLPFCLLTAGITVGIYILDRNDIVQLTFSNDSGFDVLTTLISFLVVNRVSRSYQRMWQARSLLSACYQNARDLAVLVGTLHAAHDGEKESDGVKVWHKLMENAIIHLIEGAAGVVKEDYLTVRCVLGSEKAETVARNLGVDPLEAKNRAAENLSDIMTSYANTELTDDEGRDYNDNSNDGGDDEKMKDIIGNNEGEYDMRYDVFLLSNKVHMLINNHDEYIGRTMEPQREMVLHQQAQEFTLNLYELLKFASTPVPFPTTQMTQTVMFIWLLFLPSVLYYEAQHVDCDDDEDEDECREDLNVSLVTYLAFIAFIAVYAFWGLERVAEELDLPFGDDDNDIEVVNLAAVSRRRFESHDFFFSLSILDCVMFSEW